MGSLHVLVNSSVKNQEYLIQVERTKISQTRSHVQVVVSRVTFEQIVRNFICYSCGKVGYIADSCRGKKSNLNNFGDT